MPRPKKYATDAERQAAYRARKEAENGASEELGSPAPELHPPATEQGLSVEEIEYESAEARTLRLQDEAKALGLEIEADLSQQQIRNKHGYSVSEKRTKAQRDQAAARMVARSRRSLKAMGTSEQEIRDLWQRQAEQMQASLRNPERKPVEK